ncbi:MAG: CDP-diacylglycerol--glycerol-3-phosphate 3-phosphatidyltransferase [Spirochaetes bacterium]|nr:CDP-diacylglycerol--glycerol-3-phosphate 3-phosphatidyltransferase [Spirochaetota bacterium]
MNIPNTLSILRIVLIPLFLYLIFIARVEERIWALVVFIIASLTDLLDGWSARKLGQETALGKFLDPLADKFLVLAALIAFLFLDPLVPVWMILVIILRDVLLTLMRYIAIKRNSTLKTTRFGKVKTAFQMVSIIIIIMVLIVRSSMGHLAVKTSYDDIMKFNQVYEIITSEMPNKWLIVAPYCLMALVTLLTALSGIRYIATNRHLFLPSSFKKDKSKK